MNPESLPDDETGEIPLVDEAPAVHVDEPADPSLDLGPPDVLPPLADDAVAEDEPLAVPRLEEPIAVAESTSHDGLSNIIQTFGERLDRRMDQLQTLIEREIRAEATREKVVDRLHAELQEYKQDLLLNTLRPVFIDLIQLHDDIGKVATSASIESTEADRRWLDLMADFQQGIEDILYRQGVEPFLVEDEGFDPRRQRAVSTVVTDDPALNKRVASRLRKGFRAGERVIRPEVVSVYALKK